MMQQYLDARLHMAYPNTAKRIGKWGSMEIAGERPHDGFWGLASRSQQNCLT